MTEKTDKKQNRDHLFKPGQSGNPKGRPKGTFGTLTSLLKAKLEEVPEGKKEAYKDMFIKTLLHKGLVEKDLQSLKLVINYVDGLPKASMDVTSGGEPIPLLGGQTNALPDNNSNKKTTETEQEN